MDQEDLSVQTSIDGCYKNSNAAASNMEKEILQVWTNKYRKALYEAEFAVHIYESGGYIRDVGSSCHSFSSTTFQSSLVGKEVVKSKRQVHTTCSDSDYVFNNCKRVVYDKMQNGNTVQGCGCVIQCGHNTLSHSDKVDLHMLGCIGASFHHFNMDITVMPSWQSDRDVSAESLQNGRDSSTSENPVEDPQTEDAKEEQPCCNCNINKDITPLQLSNGQEANKEGLAVEKSVDNAKTEATEKGQSCSNNDKHILPYIQRDEENHAAGDVFQRTCSSDKRLLTYCVPLDEMVADRLLCANVTQQNTNCHAAGGDQQATNWQLLVPGIERPTHAVCVQQTNERHFTVYDQHTDERLTPPFCIQHNDGTPTVCVHLTDDHPAPAVNIQHTDERPAPVVSIQLQHTDDRQSLTPCILLGDQNRYGPTPSYGSQDSNDKQSPSGGSQEDSNDKQSPSGVVQIQRRQLPSADLQQADHTLVYVDDVKKISEREMLAYSVQQTVCRQLFDYSFEQTENATLQTCYTQLPSDYFQLVYNKQLCQKHFEKTNYGQTPTDSDQHTVDKPGGGIQHSDKSQAPFYDVETENDGLVHNQKQIRLGVNNIMDCSEMFNHLQTKDVTDDEQACQKFTPRLDSNVRHTSYVDTQAPSLDNLSPIIPFSDLEDGEYQIDTGLTPTSTLRLSDKIEIHVSDISDADNEDEKHRPQVMTSERTAPGYVEVVSDSDSCPEDIVSSHCTMDYFPAVVRPNVLKALFMTGTNIPDNERYFNAGTSKEVIEFGHRKDTDCSKSSSASRPIDQVTFSPAILSETIVAHNVNMAAENEEEPLQKQKNKYKDYEKNPKNILSSLDVAGPDDDDGTVKVLESTELFQNLGFDWQLKSPEAYQSMFINNASMDKAFNVSNQQEMSDFSLGHTYNQTFLGVSHERWALSPPMFSSSEDGDVDIEINAKVSDILTHSPSAYRKEIDREKNTSSCQPVYSPTTYTEPQHNYGGDRNIFHCFETFQSGKDLACNQGHVQRLQTQSQICQVSPGSKNSSLTSSNQEVIEATVSDTSVGEQPNDFSDSRNSSKPTSDDKTANKSESILKGVSYSDAVLDENLKRPDEKSSSNTKKVKSLRKFSNKIMKTNIPSKQKSKKHQTTSKNLVHPCEIRLVNIKSLIKQSVSLNKLSAKSLKKLGLSPESVNVSSQHKNHPTLPTAASTLRTGDKNESSNTQISCVLTKSKQIRSRNRQRRIAEVQTNLIRISIRQNNSRIQADSSLQNLSLEEQVTPEECAGPAFESSKNSDSAKTTVSHESNKSSAIKSNVSSGSTSEDPFTVERAQKPKNNANVCARPEKETGPKTLSKNCPNRSKLNCMKNQNPTNISSVLPSKSPTLIRKVEKKTPKKSATCVHFTTKRGASSSLNSTDTAGAVEKLLESHKAMREEQQCTNSQVTLKLHEKSETRKRHCSSSTQNQVHNDRQEKTLSNIKDKSKTSNATVLDKSNISSKTAKKIETAIATGHHKMKNVEECNSQSLKLAYPKNTCSKNIGNRKEVSATKSYHKPSLSNHKNSYEKTDIESFITKKKNKGSPLSKEVKLKGGTKSSNGSEPSNNLTKKPVEGASLHNVFTGSNFKIPKKSSSTNVHSASTPSCESAQPGSNVKLANSEAPKKQGLNIKVSGSVPSQVKTSKYGTEITQESSQKSSDTRQATSVLSKANRPPSKAFSRRPSSPNSQRDKNVQAHGHHKEGGSRSSESDQLDCVEGFLSNKTLRFRNETSMAQNSRTESAASKRVNNDDHQHSISSRGNFQPGECNTLVSRLEGLASSGDNFLGCPMDVETSKNEDHIMKADRGSGTQLMWDATGCKVRIRLSVHLFVFPF
ncbi:hypothetical protein ElyMa_001859200 [Elysia marginata]|uniref:Uncharacterized protein n=1 Tax=Elysia marginata TaxID=1093978 RepID=A0AAV4EMZ9_9GAST|nr:hypothetical protein ElyMa_001859200 [Elysia marginata]